ncbi:hypothetical protein [Sphingomonas alba]|uniref:Uncharacterized protein n=1 Tax=Sphingomonas alba TaxID=2908208 RepID=A0ABT0RPJ1_9SPHN|nr:hypothetical protein [Sphingomonas alba]MCL6684552.1 hypothetical protein [Sphingomonas alba]
MDLKALGYLISTVSVILLGIVAWPKPDEPQWKAVLVAIGMLTSIGGMGFRWLSHRKEKAVIAYARRESERAKSEGKA